MSPKDYIAFGLHIRSALVLPDLAEADATAASGAPDVTIRLGEVPVLEGRQQRWLGVDDFILAVRPARYRIRTGSEIIVDPLPDGAPSELIIFLLGSAMAALCLQRDLWAFHANAFVLDGHAVAVAGRPGAGKSTLAALLHDRGYEVLCDDLCVCRIDDHGDGWTWPGISRLKLLPDALAATGRHKHAHGQVGGPVEKYHVALPPIARKAPYPLRRIYLLDGPETAGNGGFQRLAPEPAIGALIAQTYRQHQVYDSGRRLAQFRWAVAAAQRLSVFRMRLPRGVDVFEESANLLIAHLRETSANAET